MTITVTHFAKSMLVQALAIASVTPTDGGYTLGLANGTNYFAPTAMTLIHMPVAGDYLVTHDTGFEYLAAKTIFELQYTASSTVPTSPPVDETTRRVQMQGRYQQVER